MLRAHTGTRFDKLATKKKEKEKEESEAQKRHVAMFRTHLRRLLRMYRPGHVEKDRANRLRQSDKAAITSVLRLGRSEEFGRASDFLPGHKAKAVTPEMVESLCGSLGGIPTGSPSRGGDVTGYVGFFLFLFLFT